MWKVKVKLENQLLVISDVAEVGTIPNAVAVVAIIIIIYYNKCTQSTYR